MIPMNGLQQTLKSDSHTAVPVGKGDSKSSFSAPGMDTLFEHALKEKIKPDLEKDSELEGALAAATLLQSGNSVGVVHPRIKPVESEALEAVSIRKGPLNLKSDVQTMTLKERDVDSISEKSTQTQVLQQLPFQAEQMSQKAGTLKHSPVINPEIFQKGGDSPISAVNLVDPRVSEILSNSELNVQEFELKEAGDSKSHQVSKEISLAQKDQPQALPSRVSTEDFMSLRGIREKKAVKSEAQPKAGQPTSFALTDGKIHLGPTLEAPVTQGTAGKAILSHDALNQISNQVNLMSKAKQDGEIKIRLKPDHLGELMMSVKTNGQHVSLQIKAQDHESKRIIEESLGRLKDSLATQSLDLGKVDVVTQPNPSQGSDFGLQMDLGQQGRGFHQGAGGQDSSGLGGGRQEFHYDEAPISSNLKSINVAARSGRAGGPGSLDLIA